MAPFDSTAEDVGTRASHNADGVDRTLIRWFLTLTPAERLAALESCVNDILKMRNVNN